MARSQNAGMLALIGLGIFYAYRNRYKIQEFLESYGVKTPLDTSSAGSAISSGLAKASGSIQNVVKNGQKDLGSEQRKLG